MTHNGNLNTDAVQAVAYIRTSSAANVGADKDSDKRQRAAIDAPSPSAPGFELVAEFYDAAVSGADQSKPAQALPPCWSISRAMAFAPSSLRPPIASPATLWCRRSASQLQAHGIELIAADSPQSFLDDAPTVEADPAGPRRRRRVRQGHDGRQAARRPRAQAQETGKCEGRKSHAERNPELVALVKQLHRRRPKGGQRSLREISAELAARGHFNERGNPYSAASISSMLETLSVADRSVLSWKPRT